MKVSVMKETGPSRKAGLKAAEDERATGFPTREEMIATAAYYRAEARGFAPGCEMDDWLAAEQAFVANHDSSE